MTPMCPWCGDKIPEAMPWAPFHWCWVVKREQEQEHLPAPERREL